LEYDEDTGCSVLIYTLRKKKSFGGVYKNLDEANKEVCSLKIKYLSLEDRQNIRVLRHASDDTLKLNILESIMRRPFYTLQALWEYRRWFLELTEEQMAERPLLKQGLAQIMMMQGDLKRAREMIDWMKPDGPYQLNARLMMPGITHEVMHDIACKLAQNRWLADNYIITAGRPSILNGAWDMTPYTEDLLEDSAEMKDTLHILFPKQDKVIFELAQAEALYWRNDCYKALVMVVGSLPYLKESRDIRLLFVALTLELYILVINGQAVSVEDMTRNLRQQLKSSELEAYLPNIDAMEAWSAMYTGDYAHITKWMRNAAPDEFGKFCMLDLFRYMVKMRAYIIQGKYLAVTSLCQRLLPLLEQGRRYMDTCELHILWAISEHADGREAAALEHLEKALELSRTYRYDRLFADEGQRLYKLLKLYRKKHGGAGNDFYLEQLISMAEKTAALHPRYLKSQLPKQPALTETEMRVLRLLADYRTNAEIAEITGTAEETVKKHCKHILEKLEVANRHQAVDRAVEMGVLEPKRGYVNSG